jgi:hypothetical protein
MRRWLSADHGGPPGSELVQHAKTLVHGKPALVEYRHLVDDPAGFLVLRPDGYVATSGKLAAQLGHVWQQLERVVRDAKPAN